MACGTRPADVSIGSGWPCSIWKTLRQVLRRSDEWVFAPETPYERQGDVNGVVFPCGWILDQPSGAIRLYYGGADTCLALATAQLPSAELSSHLPGPMKRSGRSTLDASLGRGTSRIRLPKT